MSKLIEELFKFIEETQAANHESFSSICRRMGTDNKQLWRLKNGKTRPRVDTIERYVALLNGHIDYKVAKNA